MPKARNGVFRASRMNQFFASSPESLPWAEPNHPLSAHIVFELVVNLLLLALDRVQSQYRTS